MYPILNTNKTDKIKMNNYETKWTKDQVLEYFDSHWEVTLGQLSLLSAWSISDLKIVLNELVNHETSELR
jgi:hypothetical protein